MGWIASGIGVAGIGIGASTGLAGQPRKNTADRKCDNPTNCPDGRYTASTGGPSLGAVSATAWIVGAVGTGAGLYLLLGSGHEPEKRTRLSADFYRGGAGVRVSRHF
jgi:hypothetical protein